MAGMIGYEGETDTTQKHFFLAVSFVMYIRR
jgi:hypothetical protein